MGDSFFLFFFFCYLRFLSLGAFFLLFFFCFFPSFLIIYFLSVEAYLTTGGKRIDAVLFNFNFILITSLPLLFTASN